MADETGKDQLSVLSVTSLSTDGSPSTINKKDTDNSCEKRNGTRFVKPTTPSARDRWGRLKTTMNVTSNMAGKKKNGLDRGDSFLRKFSTRNQPEETIIIENEDNKTKFDRSYRKHRTCGSYVIHPSGGLMFYWLGVVTLIVLYNLWTCIAREAFREIQDGYMIVWFSLDGFSDFIYICDIFVQFRTGYLQQGLMVYDTRKLCVNYMRSKCFITDLLCLFPLDFLQFYTGIHAMLRFPRFLKIYRAVRFMHMYESRTAYPNLLRVLNLSHILFLGSHWFAAFYYLISEAEGFEGGWSYPHPEGMYASVTRKYLASLYWSTLTLTTIGDLPPPDTNWQYVFVIVSYLIGVFIFATIVGQVGNVITNRNASRQEFERLLDGAKFYMQMHNVPPDLQKRVQRWYDYVWTRGRLNCNDINSLGLLPDKLKTELALHVNLGTLRKVTIFQKCRPEFLHDLMLKMRAYIFTPGDLICRRGEVAREMFIIADGVVEIIGENSTVLTQMSTGDFFGEIGILNLDGGINRRTADVRSVGYSELFVLSREDVLAALKDHPDAEEILHAYARRRLDNLMSQRSTEDGRTFPSTSRSISVGSDDGEASSRSASPRLRVFMESSSSSDDNTDVEDRPLPPSTIPIRVSSRDSISRKSSPCVLNLPSAFTDRLNRRISLPPPLDLPIEVPKFSNFHGLTRNASDVSHTLDRFKDSMERRMDDLESSYKQTMTRLDETTKMQERFMKTIIKKLSVGKEKMKDRAESNISTDINNTTNTLKLVDDTYTDINNTNSLKLADDISTDTNNSLKLVGDTITNRSNDTNQSVDITVEQSAPTRHSIEEIDTAIHENIVADATQSNENKTNPKRNYSDSYSSGSSTDEQVSNNTTYAVSSLIDNLQNQLYEDSPRQSSMGSLQLNMLNGLRKPPESFQVLEEKQTATNNTDTSVDESVQPSVSFEYQLDDIRVTHL